MPEQRMSLEEAGRLLGGLHPNTVRARAAKGKIRYEKDNSGKWFVFTDPEKAASNTLGARWAITLRAITLGDLRVDVWAAMRPKVIATGQEHRDCQATPRFTR